MDTRPHLETAIKEHLAPVLKSDGFKGSGRTYRRVNGDLIQIVNVQGSRSGGKFAINLAVHPLCIPDLRSETPNPSKIIEEYCEFRCRLSEHGADQWWEYENSMESMSEAIKAATSVYCSVGRPLFEPFCGQNTPLHQITAAELENGSQRLYGFGSTKVRMALGCVLNHAIHITVETRVSIAA